MNLSVNASDFMHLAPLLFVGFWACLVLLAGVMGAGRTRQLGALSALGLVLGIGVCLWSWGAHQEPATHLFGGMMLTDRFALFIDAVLLLAGLLTVMVSGPYIEEHRFAEEDFFGLLMLALCGMMMLVHANNFVMLVIGLETMSLAVYALVACWVGKRASAEAGMKYFVMGATASAFLLYGIALIYGVSGVTSLPGLVGRAEELAGNPIFLLGMFMVLGALAFKVALVPFHMWVPDAYEGAPTPVTGFMAAAVKVAGFGVLLRVVSSVFGAEFFVKGSTGWFNTFWVIAALTMTVGNVAAIRQPNIKRMLAYSSVSHAGYLLLGVMAVGLGQDAVGAVLFYLLAYAVTTLGAFAVVAWIGGRDGERVNLEDWAGVARRHPVVALVMTLFLLSLGGIPPTAGFFAKFYLFKVALAHEQLLPLVIVAAINSVISLFYYLRPVVAMYFEEGGPEARPLGSASIHATLGVATVLVLLLGLLPNSSLQWAVSSLIGQ